jgi:hypothetical protein
MILYGEFGLRNNKNSLQYGKFLSPFALTNHYPHLLPNDEESKISRSSDRLCEDEIRHPLQAVLYEDVAIQGN